MAKQTAAAKLAKRSAAPKAVEPEKKKRDPWAKSKAEIAALNTELGTTKQLQTTTAKERDRYKDGEEVSQGRVLEVTRKMHEAHLELDATQKLLKDTTVSAKEDRIAMFVARAKANGYQAAMQAMSLTMEAEMEIIARLAVNAEYSCAEANRKTDKAQADCCELRQELKKGGGGGAKT